MSTFMPRNNFNKHLSDAKFEWFKKKAFLREKASVLSNGTREDTNRIADLLIEEEYLKYLDIKEQTDPDYDDEKLDEFCEAAMRGEIDDDQEISGEEQ